MASRTFAHKFTSLFKDNDVNLWANVRLAITDYLQQKWKKGILLGETEAEAYYVKVGLGETMTPLDLQERRVIVEVGLALVEPDVFNVISCVNQLPLEYDA